MALFGGGLDLTGFINSDVIYPKVYKVSLQLWFCFKPVSCSICWSSHPLKDEMFKLFFNSFYSLPRISSTVQIVCGFFSRVFFRIKFYTLKRGQVVFSLLTFAFCEVILVCAFIVTVAKMLWIIIIIMLIWKLVQWVQEAVKQLQLTSNNFWI